jgi:hypothetical protein
MLKGAYPIEGQGTILMQLPGLPAPPAPFDEVGIDMFNRDGTFTGAVTVNIGGVVFPVTVTATYTVNNDCSGTATINTSIGGDRGHCPGQQVVATHARCTRGYPPPHVEIAPAGLMSRFDAL